MGRKKMKTGEKFDVRLRMDEALHKRIAEAAKAEGNSIAAFIRSAVVKELNKYERRGEPVDDEAMRKEVEMRDRVDSERAIAPLRPAEDALVIDTDNLSLDEVVDTILTDIGDTVGGA